MKSFFIQIMCWVAPNNLLLRFVNHPNFTDEQIGIIGSALLKRFKTQEELEQRCERLFGETF